MNQKRIGLTVAAIALAAIVATLGANEMGYG
jgi:hypothetical protein